MTTPLEPAPERRAVPRDPAHDGEAPGGGRLRAVEGPLPPPHEDARTVDDVALGDLLREARRRRGLTIDEVSRDTRVNPAYLEALEAERFELLPAPVYARGFLRSYARHLGLDPEVAVAMMPQDLPRPPGLDPAAGLRRRTGEGLPSLLPALRLRPLAYTGAGLALLAIVLIGLTRVGGGDAGNAEVAATAPADGSTVIAAGPAPGSSEPATAESGAGEVAAVPTVPPFEEGELPNFRGVVRGEAEAVLTDLGLSFVVIEVASDRAAAGIVFDQSPEPGSETSEDLNVTLVVSQGPPPD